MSLFSHPVKKLTLLAAFGIGYTLGAKAGRERYQQIVDAAHQVKSDPRVQDAASKAEDLVRETANKVADDPRVKDVVSKAEGLLGDAADKAKDVASDDDLVDKAKDVAGDIKDKAEDVAGDVKDAAKDDSLLDKAKGAAKDAKAKAEDVAGDVKGKADDTISPLLADEHVDSIDEVVHSVGQDIEETIDELAPTDGKDRI